VSFNRFLNPFFLLHFQSQSKIEKENATVNSKVGEERTNEKTKFPFQARNLRPRGKGSISPTFYAQLLRTQISRTAFLCLRFRFVLYWRKTVSAKAAHRTLMKLTQGHTCLMRENPFNELKDKKMWKRKC
jgi:hypothetical protein